WIANDVAQRVGAVVATAVWQHERRIVDDAYEAGLVAARRAVQALRSARGQDRERRDFDQRSIPRREMRNLLDQRRFARLTIQRFELFQSGDDRHDLQPSTPAAAARALRPAGAATSAETSKRCHER